MRNRENLIKEHLQLPTKNESVSTLLGCSAKRCRAAILVTTILGLSNGWASAEENKNVLALSNGTVLKSFNTQFGHSKTSEWIALGLIDGNPKLGWSSAENAIFPHDFLFELPAVYGLKSLRFDNVATEEATHPGIAARDVVVSVSTKSAETGFETVFKGRIPADEVSTINLPAQIEARWIKLSIASNGGHAQYTELMEFSAFGTQKGPRRVGVKTSSGVYETNWGRFFLSMKNGELRGCYDHDDGQFNGFLVDGVMNLRWREKDDQTGTAALAITEDGSSFSGYWYEKAKVGGTWMGRRLAVDAERPKCAKALIQPASSQVAASMDKVGRATLYGIYFDYDSDVIKPRSARTLGYVLDWMRSNPAQSVVFGGHTDSVGSDVYNAELSGRRAMAVVRWLENKGIGADRMTGLGFGESEPVADNVTARGRSLNRRVEVSVRR